MRQIDWRRGRDSNPGKARSDLQRLSKPPQSTTLPPLRFGVAVDEMLQLRIVSNSHRKTRANPHHQKSIIQNQSSGPAAAGSPLSYDIQHRTSNPTSSIEHRAPSIQSRSRRISATLRHPTSSIEHRASSIEHPASISN